jgi:hypothetical protein
MVGSPPVGGWRNQVLSSGEFLGWEEFLFMGSAILSGSELRGCPLPFSIGDVARWKGRWPMDALCEYLDKIPQQSAYRALRPEGWREPEKWKFPSRK